MKSLRGLEENKNLLVIFKIMSKLYLFNPVTEPKKILSDLGVWTPEEYEAELKTRNLSDDEILEKMDAFRFRYADCEDFYRTMLELDLKKDVLDVANRKKQTKHKKRKTGGASGFTKISEEESPSYRKHISGIDMLAQDEEMEKYGIDQNMESILKRFNFDKDAQKAIRACRDPAVYNIDGQPLPFGKILDECVNIYRAKNDTLKLYHRSVLEAAMQCKESGVSDSDMETCVFTKLGEMKALLSVTSNVMINIGMNVEKATSDTDTFIPGEERDLKMFEKHAETAKTTEQKSWARFMIDKVKDSAVWVASGATSLALWVVKDPKTAKIVFFILKRIIKDACSYVYTNWLSHEKEYVSYFQKYWESTKNFVSSSYELTKFAVVAGFQKYLQGDGFKRTWKKASSVVGSFAYEITYDFIGWIPGARGAVKALGAIINDIAQESVQIGMEVAIYESNVRYAGQYFVEILFQLMPVQIVRDDKGGFTMQWNQNPESCVGIFRQRTKVIGTDPLSEADTQKELKNMPILPPADGWGLLNIFTKSIPTPDIKANRIGNPMATSYNITPTEGIDQTQDQEIVLKTSNQPKVEEPAGWFSFFTKGGGQNPEFSPQIKRIRRHQQLPPQMSSNTY